MEVRIRAKEFNHKKSSFLLKLEKIIYRASSSHGSKPLIVIPNLYQVSDHMTLEVAGSIAVGTDTLLLSWQTTDRLLDLGTMAGIFWYSFLKKDSFSHSSTLKV